MNNSDRVSQSIQKVGEELLAMPREQLLAELESHKSGDIAQMMMETGAADLVLQDLKNKRQA